MSTAPWQADTPDLITEAHGQQLRAVATHPDFDAPVDLTARDVSVTFDEARAPRCTSSLTVAVPNVAALFAQLDPRTGARVEVQAGYVRPGGDEDIFPLADLGIRSIVPDLAASTARVECAGDEALVVDASPAVTGSVTGASHAAAVQTLINQCISPAPLFTASMSGGAVTVDPVLDRWATIQDLADRLDAKVYDTGLRNWVMEASPTIAGAPVLALTVGEGGTILNATPQLDRDTWHNYVTLRYRWRDGAGVEQQILATAYIATGPYRITGPAGKRIMLDDREVPTTQAAANAAAAAVLGRAQTRSRTFSLTAISAYWLRPGHTISVRLIPGAEPELHLVRSVTFRGDGSMDLETRIPDPTWTAPPAAQSTTPPAAPPVLDPVPPAKTTYVSTWTANLDRTFKQNGTQNTVAAPDVIQGFYDGTNGNQQGVILFTAANSTGSEAGVSITTALTGATLSKVELWLYANHWWSAGGGAARIGKFGGSSLPSTYSAAAPHVTVSGWRRGSGRWVTITSPQLVTELLSGFCRGVTVGPGVGASRTYYGKFNGSGASSSKPLLRLTYAK